MFLASAWRGYSLLPYIISLSFNSYFKKMSIVTPMKVTGSLLQMFRKWEVIKRKLKIAKETQ